ncbi:MAG: aminopeptidase P N-terminal domain-containing protein, partial [Bacteroidaceae bacterium]|nr:aminopeptidase P N-terminal domain-containing protein [Bacteroidaceae bacterium]
MTAFTKETYIQRRQTLKQKLGSGLVLIFGHNQAPANYPANAYTFRQDSSFLYYFGQNQEGLVGVIDIDNDRECLIGNDIDIEDIIWTGFVPSIHDLAQEVGIEHSAPMAELQQIVDRVRKAGQEFMFLPPCRHDLMIQIGDLMGIHPLRVREAASVRLI